MGFEVCLFRIGSGRRVRVCRSLGGWERVKSLGFKVEGGSRVSSVGFGVECGVSSGFRV